LIRNNYVILRIFYTY